MDIKRIINLQPALNCKTKFMQSVTNFLLDNSEHNFKEVLKNIGSLAKFYHVNLNIQKSKGKILFAETILFLACEIIINKIGYNKSLEPFINEFIKYDAK